MTPPKRAHGVLTQKKDGQLPVFLSYRKMSAIPTRLCVTLARLGFGFGGCGGLWDGDYAVGALDAGSFALEVAEIVQAGAADFAFANDVHRADRGRVQREDALDAHAEAYAADGESGAGRAALFGDDHAFEGLETLFFLLAFAFFEANVHANGVANAKVRKIGAQLRVVQFLNYRVHVLDSLQTHSGGACALWTITDYRGIGAIFLANLCTAEGSARPTL